MYLVYIFICCGIKSEYLSFDNIIIYNQRLTILIFLFVIADCFIISAQKLQKETYRKDSDFEKKLDEYNNNINFTTQSLYLIGVPTLV